MPFKQRFGWGLKQRVAFAFLDTAVSSTEAALHALQASLDQNVPITAITQEAMLSEIATREAAQREGDD